jgi:hypothetical protein
LQKSWQQLITTVGFSIVTSLGGLPVFSALAGTTWQIGSQPTLILEYPTAQATTRITQLDRRLAEIVANLDPTKVWSVDTFPAINNPKPNNLKPVNPIPLRSVTIRVQGQPLLEVTEEDARVHNAASVEDLAKTWVQALAYALNQPLVKQRLVGTVGMPSQLVYKGKTYYLDPEVVGDRGWFRTDGQRVAGKVVFWELAPDKRAYVPSSSTRSSAAPESPSKIFILNRYMQFVPYSSK